MLTTNRFASLMNYEPIDINPWQIVNKTYTRSDTISHFISRLIPKCIFKKSNDTIFTGTDALKQLNHFILTHPGKIPFSDINVYHHGTHNSSHTLNLSDECIIIDKKLSMMYELKKYDLFISQDFQTELRNTLLKYCPSGYFFFDTEQESDDNVLLNIYVSTKRF
jgi:hypothetical protein